MADTYGSGAGNPAETLNNRAGVQGGATIVTQFNRDNLDSFGGPSAAGNDDEIDDLRREQWLTRNISLTKVMGKEWKQQRLSSETEEI